MKSKYLGLVALALIAVSVLGSTAYLGWSFMLPQAQLTEEADVKRLWTSIPKTDPADMTAMADLQQRFSRLLRPRKRRSGDVSYDMLGFSAREIATYENVAAATTERFDNHIISMAYVSGDQRYAVIDGKLYKEGDSLGTEGGRVRTITPTKVLIAGKEVRQWLEVHNPVAAKPKAEEPAPQQPAAPTPPAQPPRPSFGAKQEESSSNAVQAIEALKGYTEMLKQLRGLGQ